MKQIPSAGLQVLICLLFLLQSCTLFRYAYSPTIQNVPAFTGKNESRITAIIASPASGTENNFAFQGAYAVTNHFAITAGLNGTAKSQDELTYTNGNGSSQKDVVKYKRNSTEFGAGVFYPVSKDNKAFFELYAGYGFGSNKITDLTNSTTTYYHNSDINRVYLQPVLSIHPSAFFTISTSLRFTSIGYRNINTNYSQGDLSSYSLDAIAEKRLFFIEPALVISGGIKDAPWVRLQGQMNLSLLAGEATTNYRSNYFGMGLIFDPAKAFQNKKN